MKYIMTRSKFSDRKEDTSVEVKSVGRTYLVQFNIDYTVETEHESGTNAIEAACTCDNLEILSIDYITTGGSIPMCRVAFDSLCIQLRAQVIKQATEAILAKL